MTKVVLKDINKRGANSTLCDPRNKFGNINISCKLEKLETSLRKQYKQIVFSHCITSVQERPLTNSTLITFILALLCHITISPSSTPRAFHVEMTWKLLFPRRFTVEYTWCVCREAVDFSYTFSK